VNGFLCMLSDEWGGKVLGCSQARCRYQTASISQHFRFMLHV